MALQAFGLIVTAEPYYAVSTPSDVVVLKNVFTDNTNGVLERVAAHTTLYPRGLYSETTDGAHTDRELDLVLFGELHPPLIELDQARHVLPLLIQTDQVIQGERAVRLELGRPLIGFDRQIRLIEHVAARFTDRPSA